MKTSGASSSMPPHCLTFQLFFQFLPGKKSYLYYKCASPDETISGTPMQNVQSYLVFAMSFIVYVFVHGRIKFYQVQVLRTDFQIEGHQITKSTLASFITLSSVILLFSAGVFLGTFLNSLDPTMIGRSPYYQLALVHQHIFFLVIVGQLVLSYFISNVKLRENIYRELKSQLLWQH